MLTLGLLVGSAEGGEPPRKEVSAARAHEGGARLRNHMDNSALKTFQATVERQARNFSNFFLEGKHPYNEKGESNFSLTFDDGPDDVYTPAILDILKKYNIKATFFLVGELAEKYPAMAKRIKDEGHAIGGHAHEHVDMRKLDTKDMYANQVEKTRELLARQLGFSINLFRAPYGVVTDSQIEECRKHGVVVANWSVDSFDWRKGYDNPQQIEQVVVKHAHPGGFALFHSGRDDRSATVAALPHIIDKLLQRGFAFNRVDDALDVPR